MDDAHLFFDGETLLSQEGTTQGDPLAMAMYAIGILPLINQLKSNHTKQARFADNATSGRGLVHEWQCKLNELGPAYGYFANSKKTWLIVKERYLPKAKELFSDSGMNIATEGKRHLGAALASGSFVESYMQKKVVILHPQTCRDCQDPTSRSLYSIYAWPGQ